MTKTKRSWDLLSAEQRAEAIKEIINFYATERDEQIGMIAAEEILDMFLQTSAINLYNKGVEDSQEFLKERLESTIVDLNVSLKK